MEDMCTGCLSTDRKLHLIGETGQYHLYSQILNEIPIYDISQVCVRICWECRARLRAMALFKQQVKQNYSDLMQHIPRQATSNLTTHALYNLSHPETLDMKSETDVFVKSEMEEHCEPESFASALSVEHNVHTVELQKQKRKLPLQKEKKKPNVKLKSTSKKRKKQITSDLQVKVEDTDRSDYIDNEVGYNEEGRSERGYDEEGRSEKGCNENGYDVNRIDGSDDENIEMKKASNEKIIVHIPRQATSRHALYKSHPKLNVKSETDVVVKIETEEHCEPEPFASALSVGHNDLTIELPKEKRKLPLQKEKKIPKIKLKSTTKIKPNKKRKKQITSDLTENVEDTDHLDYIDNEGDNELGYNDKGYNEEGRSESGCNENGYEASKIVEDGIDDLNEENTETKGASKKIVVDLPSGVVVKRARNMEPLPERPQCQECGKVFSSKKTYRYHLNVLHKGQNQHPCPRCGKVYQWKSNLGRHMRTHRAVDDGELHCSLCDKWFASVATYRQHLRLSRRHVPEADFSFVCDDCGKRFVNKTQLRDHVDWEHLKRIKFRCALCDKAFKCHTSLYLHTQNVHIGKDRKDNLCHVCGKSYQNAAKLRYHITAMHSGETPYRCAHCAAAFGWYSSLYRHMREVHYKMKGVAKKSKKLKPPPPHYTPL